jgi:hypothetical protein
MKSRGWLASLIALIVLLAACDASAPQPRANDTPVATPLPAVEATAATATPLITQTAPHPQPQPVEVGGAPASIFDDAIVSPPAKRILIAELALMRDALTLLASTGWDGNIDAPVPLKQTDFDATRLNTYIADAEANNVLMVMPPDLEPLYISDQSAQDIRALMTQAHREYVDYLHTQQVQQRYLDELEQVLPADASRMVYHPINSADVMPSAVDGVVLSDGSQDFSRYKLDVYTVDLYNIATDLAASGILGAEPTTSEGNAARLTQWRDMAVRKLIYHEMTHAVQRAYLNVHVDDAGYRMSESAYLWARASLASVDATYHWHWGNSSTVAESNNQHISNESQADGIAFEVLTAVYNMSPAQRDAVWDHLFGRLDMARATIDEIQQLCESRFPTFVPDGFGSPLAATLDDYTLKKLAFRLVNLSAYAGYLHPMQPQDTEKFWVRLQES